MLTALSCYVIQTAFILQCSLACVYIFYVVYQKQMTMFGCNSKGVEIVTHNRVFLMNFAKLCSEMCLNTVFVCYIFLVTKTRTIKKTEKENGLKSILNKIRPKQRGHF